MSDDGRSLSASRKRAGMADLASEPRADPRRSAPLPWGSRWWACWPGSGAIWLSSIAACAPRRSRPRARRRRQPRAEDHRPHRACGSQSSTAAAPPGQPARRGCAEGGALRGGSRRPEVASGSSARPIWRTETVTPGPGHPPELAIRADVEVPERKIAMTWSLRRNTDKSLPASHTVEIVFKLPTDFPAGGISNVPGILMKQAEQTRGVPLSGLGGEGHERIFPDRALQRRRRQGAQSPAAQGSRLVRHSGCL